MYIFKNFYCMFYNFDMGIWELFMIRIYILIDSIMSRNYSFYEDFFFKFMKIFYRLISFKFLLNLGNRRSESLWDFLI